MDVNVASNFYRRYRPSGLTLSELVEELTIDVNLNTKAFAA